jgi:hypothetical protein
MGETKTRLRPELRIYCLCGQKMRVTSSMYGRPGKCVACRQKIRIPRLDEVPTGVTELYLRDHPEFLRKSGGKALRSGERPPALVGSEPVPEQDLVLGDDAEQAQNVPADPLRPLQILCSYEAKINNRLLELREAAKDSDSAREKTALMGYRALVRNGRAALDDQLRQRLHEVTDQLGTLRERIARASLGLRVGDMTFAEYATVIGPLRARRDRLERRRVNLTGWLHTQDPYVAGGFIDLPYDEIPVNAMEVGFPVEHADSGAPLVTRLTLLREALQEREDARRKLEGLQRMQREDQVDQAQSKRMLRDADARVQRARVRLEFERGRVEQLIQDCESDNRAIRAHLEEAQAAVEAGQKQAAAYAEVEQAMLRAQGDLNESRALARKALKAERPGEVPGPNSALVKRIRQRTSTMPLAEDIAGWLSAVGLGSTVLLPLAAHQGGSNWQNFPLLTGMLLSGAVAAICCALIPLRQWRGFALLNIWAFLCVISVFLLHQARFSLEPIGGVLRMNPRWFFTPGMLVLGVSLMGLGMASSIMLARFERWRIAPLSGALLAVLAIAFILTDFGGVWRSKPQLEAPVFAESANRPGQYEVTIPVSNQGTRPLWIGGSPERVPDSLRFVLQKKVGEQLSWEDYTHRNESSGPYAGDNYVSKLTTTPRMPVVEVSPGEQRPMRYLLEPGYYRASLIGVHYGKAEEQSIAFELPALAQRSPAQARQPAAEEATTPPSPTAPPALPTGRQMAQVKLQGVLASQSADPQFSLLLDLGNGRLVNQRIGLGDQVIGQWYASEYSPATQNVTVSDGRRMLVLERGAVIELEYTDEVAPENAPVALPGSPN